MPRPKKNSYKEFDNKKKIPAAQKFPTFPHNFSNGPSLMKDDRDLKLFWVNP